MATESLGGEELFGSVQQEFDACVGLTKGFLRAFAGANAEIRIRRIDEGGLEGEPCAILYPPNKASLLASFPFLSKFLTIFRQFLSSLLFRIPKLMCFFFLSLRNLRTVINDPQEVVAVVFPVAENLRDIESLVSQLPETQPFVIVNPQWRDEGQIVSDFGFGSARQRAEAFLETFKLGYWHSESRVGTS